MHDQKCIQIKNPTKEERDMICEIVLDSCIDSDGYKARVKAGAFLQCDYEDYILVEFWRNDYQEFVNMINNRFKTAKLA